MRDKRPIYLTAGIGRKKNQSPEKIVIIDTIVTNHVGIKSHPLSTKHTGPEIRMPKKITDTNIAKLNIQNDSH